MFLDIARFKSHRFFLSLVIEFPFNEGDTVLISRGAVVKPVRKPHLFCANLLCPWQHECGGGTHTVPPGKQRAAPPEAWAAQRLGESELSPEPPGQASCFLLPAGSYHEEVERVAKGPGNLESDTDLTMAVLGSILKSHRPTEMMQDLITLGVPRTWEQSEETGAMPPRTLTQISLQTLSCPYWVLEVGAPAPGANHDHSGANCHAKQCFLSFPCHGVLALLSRVHTGGFQEAVTW